MPESFDPYYRWLGIPPKDQPANHYRLLGIQPLENNADVIETAADQRMMLLRTFQAGKQSALSQKLLNEVAAARMCLLNPEKKAAYDNRLREQVRSAGPESDDSSGDMALDPGLAAVLEASQAAAPARHAARTRPNLAAILGVAALAGVVLLGLVIWGAVQMGSSRDVAERDQRGEEPPASTPPAPSKPTRVATPVAPVKPVEKPNALGKTETPPTEPTGHPTVSEAPPAEKMEPAPKREPNAPEEPKRQPVPSSSAQREMASQVEEVYKVAAARKPAEQVKLAKDLTESAEKAAKPEERFVMLRKAAELACEADDTALMFQAVDRLGEQFELDTLATKQKLLAKLAAGANDAARIKSLVESSNVLIDQALGDERFDVALELVNAASRACQKSAGSPLRKQVVERRKEIQGLQKQWEQTAQALEAARANPEDADANLTLGQWYCFTKQDWAKGLPYLAKGSDEALKALAAQETSSPPSGAEEQVKLADGWWSIRQEAKGKSRGPILLHAGSWYEQAQPNLSAGLAKARVEKRLAEIAALGGEIPTVSGKQPPLAIAPFDEKTAKQHQARWTRYLRVLVEQPNSIGMKLVLIPPGEFDMGSPKELIEEESRLHGGDGRYMEHLPGEGPRHRVRITRPFWLGVTEVTQEEYRRVMGSNPSKFQGDPKRPVEEVSWDDAVEFCRRLSELPEEKRAKRRYVLPTEAQWEYACRAGNPGRWCSSDWSRSVPTALEEKLLGEYGWFNSNSGGQTHPVGQKRSGVWGLYDMHGNVWEWCQDCYDKEYYAKSPRDGPTGPTGGSDRLHRGGSWDFPVWSCRSACRLACGPWRRNHNLGFRVSLVLREETGTGPILAR